jgi:DedD protein
MNLLQESQEQEPRIGMMKLLGILAGLVLVCSVFFSLGYTMGQKSAAVSLIPQPAPTVATNSTPKPSPSRSLVVGDSAEPPAQTTPSTDQQPESASKPAPEMSKPGNAYVVQVAAVSRQEDAEALMSALRKKDYPVFVVNNAPGDRLFHVQVGPYAEMKDAEAMKAKLSGDGYNPILKK